MTPSILLVEGKFALSKLSPDSCLPDWCQGETLAALVRTTDELSVMCEESLVPDDVISEGNWCALKLLGLLDFSLVGIMARLATTLANVDVSIFAISTYETDYVLIKQNQLDVSLKALNQAGYSIQTPV